MFKELLQHTDSMVRKEEDLIHQYKDEIYSLTFGSNTQMLLEATGNVLYHTGRKEAILDLEQHIWNKYGEVWTDGTEEE